MKDVPCDRETYTDLKIVFSELINNAVAHGNRYDAAKKIYVSISCSEMGVTLRVRDEGEGFNPRILTDPTSETNLLLPTGRGLFLVKQLMDRVRFQRMERGMELVAEKRIA